MKKALEKIKEIIDFCDAVGCHRAIYESIKFVEKELEEAMKPKTCEWCKHYEEKQCTNENSIAFGGINAVYKDDFCNDFEPKDNA